MANIAEIEKELLRLGPADRARVALLAWESLAQDPLAATDPNFDPHGISLAQQRDGELGSSTTAISLEEFHRQTGGE